jgi:hypothetical protein
MQDAERESRGRGGLRRGVLLYLALTAIAVAICVLVFLNRASNAAFITIVIAGGIGLLFAYQTVQHIRDLTHPMARTEGAITKKFQRADLIIVWQSYYIALNRKLFRVDPHDYIMVDEGMRVVVDYFPHTLNVVAVTPDTPPPQPLPGDLEREA